MSHKYILLFSILFSGSAFSQAVKDTPTVTRQVESPDNLTTFYRDLSQSFNTRNFVGKGDLSCVLSFTIEKDGSMTRISATGDNQKFNDEVIKTLKHIRTKIKVRLENGQPIAANYRLPFRFNDN
ncbi:energy transducer TonB [Elizabethkingia ursingii]|uniref:energy transducer TonB n=1 Tax=Elizabethkingia ursingii TaxID=1756150 RepID=UPI00201381EF|nr:energy transducer TonB [Elizabethkingia ursingii]MCL1667714.1 energy transducer TonB [Elizabethkingia ursingii]